MRKKVVFIILLSTTLLTFNKTNPFHKKILNPIPVKASSCDKVDAFFENTDFHHFTYLSDGLKVKGVLGKPKFLKKKKYPVVIYNRGYAPLLELNDCRIVKYFPYFIKKGFIFIAPQYRGWAKGEGKDEFGGHDLNDIENIINVVKSLPYIDKNNLFMFGASRGGMMTYMGLRKGFPIRAASVFGGVTDQYTELLENRSDGMEVDFIKMIPGYSTNKDMELKKRSAIFWANEINTPVLIQHGEKDYHVDIKQALDMAKQLKKYNKEHELIILKNGDHCCSLDPLDPKLKNEFNSVYWYKIIDNAVSFFERYMI